MRLIHDQVLGSILILSLEVIALITVLAMEEDKNSIKLYDMIIKCFILKERVTNIEE